MVRMAAEAVADDGDLDLRALAAALWRRKSWILWPTILVAVLTAIGVNMVTPRYRSEARILYDGRENAFLRPEVDKTLNADRPPADAGNPDQPGPDRAVAAARARRHQAAQARRPAGVRSDPARDLDRAPHPVDPRDCPATTRRCRRRSGCSKSWNDRLTAYSVDKSRVIVIEFQSWDPMLAAKITNAIASTYLRMEQSLRLDQARGANQWLAGEIDQLRRRVADAEAKAEAFRSRTNLLVGTNNTTLNNQQLGEINSQVAVARGQKADSETRAKIIREMLRRGETIEALRRRQFRADPPPLRAARRAARPTRRAVDPAPRPPSPHHGTQGADRRPRQADQGRGRQARPHARERGAHRQRQGRRARARTSTWSRSRPPPPASRTSSCGRSIARRRRSATSSNPISPSTARPRRVKPSAPRRRMRRSSPPRSLRTRPISRRRCRSSSVATLITFILCCGLVATGELLRASSGAPRHPGRPAAGAAGRSRLAGKGGDGAPRRCRSPPSWPLPSRRRCRRTPLRRPSTTSRSGCARMLRSAAASR